MWTKLLPFRRPPTQKRGPLVTEGTDIVRSLLPPSLQLHSGTDSVLFPESLPRGRGLGPDVLHVLGTKRVTPRVSSPLLFPRNLWYLHRLIGFWGLQSSPVRHYSESILWSTKVVE